MQTIFIVPTRRDATYIRIIELIEYSTLQYLLPTYQCFKYKTYLLKRKRIITNNIRIAL